MNLHRVFCCAVTTYLRWGRKTSVQTPVAKSMTRGASFTSSQIDYIGFLLAAVEKPAIWLRPHRSDKSFSYICLFPDVIRYCVARAIQTRINRGRDVHH